MSSEQKEVAPPPVDSDGEDDDLFADSDDEKAQVEEEPIKSPTQITKSIVAAIKTEPVSAPETSEPEPQVVPVAVKQENTTPKPASNDTYASIPRKSATPSSPTTAPAPSSPPKVSSPIPKKTVSSPSDAAAKYGLPKETIIPSSIREDIMRHSGGKTLDNLRSLKDVKLINDALKEYDDAVKLNGNTIRHHGAYLLGVVKRYVSVQERAARSGGASIPMGNELTPPVHQRLQKLVKDGFCTSVETRDDKVQAKLKMLSEKDALAAIEEMASVDRSSVRNFGSYFMGILNRYMRGEKQQMSENKGANYQRNQSRRGRTNTKQDPNEMYRRERSRDRSNSGDNLGSYGPRGSQRGNNNPHLANYDNRRNGGGSSYYGNNNGNNNNGNGNQHQYPPTSRYQNNNNGPPPAAMGGGRLPPPPPPPPPRQSNGLPPPPPTQYQAPPQAPQMQQPQPPPQSQYGQQQPPPSQYGAQPPPPNPSYGQQQQPYGAPQQQPPNNSYYGSQQNQQQQQQQQPYGTAAPSPYGGAPQQQQQQQPYMQQPPCAPQATNGYQQQPQQQSQWQQPAAAQRGPSIPAGIVDILGIADKAASAVQALQSQNRAPNIPQQQPQAPVQPPQQQYQQPPPQQAPPMQQQQYQPQQSYQQQQPPPQQQYQQQQPPQPQGNNQYNQYGAPPPSQYGAPSPYAPQQAPPMGQQPHQQQHNRYQNQQQQNYNQPPYQGGQYPPPPQGYSQHQQQPHGNQNRGNRQGRGKARRTTAQLHELPMSVQNMVHQIQNTRQVDGPLDEGILGMVKDLPEHMALQSLQKFMSIDKKSMRSKTAYLAGVLRRELERIHRR